MSLAVQYVTSRVAQRHTIFWCFDNFLIGDGDHDPEIAEDTLRLDSEVLPAFRELVEYVYAKTPAGYSKMKFSVGRFGYVAHAPEDAIDMVVMFLERQCEEVGGMSIAPHLMRVFVRAVDEATPPYPTRN